MSSTGNNLSNNSNSLKKIGINSIKNNAIENKNINKENTPDICIVSQTKFVNRKDDKNFINEKIVIKPDLNKSIFISNPNHAFFNQANTKSKDLVVISKAEPRKHSNNNRNNNNVLANKNDKKEEEIDIKIKAPKIPDKKEVNKKISKNKNDKINKDKDIELKEKNNENVVDNNKIERENNSKNNSDIKEKVVVPPAKSKAGP